MNDKQIASLFAGQTAIMNTIVTLLIKGGTLDYTAVLNALYELNAKALIHNQIDSIGPIQHLITTLESYTDAPTPR